MPLEKAILRGSNIFKLTSENWETKTKRGGSCVENLFQNLSLLTTKSIKSVKRRRSMFWVGIIVNILCHS